MSLTRQKTLLALHIFCAILFGALWAPRAMAIPAFARQTGVPCSGCHYQHFPVLTAFGRAFKEGGFTMIGSEEKLEAEKLSLPVVLNGNIEVYSQWQKTNGSGTTTTNGKTTNTEWQIPQSASVFFGGRVGEHIGFEAEVSVYPPPAGLLNYKMPMVWDLGPVKAGVVIFGTAVYGPSFGLEVLNTGANAVHLFNQFDMPVISAQQYLNTGVPAMGADLIASNDMGFAVLGKWLPDQTSNSGGPNSNYLRLAWTPSLGHGLDFGMGIQYWGGRSSSTGNVPGTVGSGGNLFIQSPLPPTAATPMVMSGIFDTKALAADAQLMGAVGGLPYLIITSYARAPSSGAPSGLLGGFQGNLFNSGTASRRSFNVGAELGVIPEKVTLQLGLRRAKSGFALGGTSNASDNAWLVGATYAIYWNARLDLTYAQSSGDLYNGLSKQLQGTAWAGDHLTNLNLIADF